MHPITDKACGARVVFLAREDSMALCNKVPGELKVVSGGSKFTIAENGCACVERGDNEEWHKDIRANATAN
eukprot:5789124-Lingulodinium_polyedra.AAC.1